MSKWIKVTVPDTQDGTVKRSKQGDKKLWFLSENLIELTRHQDSNKKWHTTLLLRGDKGLVRIEIRGLPEEVLKQL